MSEKCVVCKSTVSTPVLDHLYAYEYGTGWIGAIKACESCGLMQQYPMPTVAGALDYYPDSYTHYNPQTTGLSALLMKLYMQRTIRFFKKMGIKKGMRVLDIGCGAGQKIAILRDALGIDPVGIEPNIIGAENARKFFGLKIYNNTFPCAELNSEKFDAVYINHVIEHVPDPVKLLNDIYSFLKPGGIIIGETENLNCLSFRVFNRFWALLHLPFHLLFFNKVTLRNVFLSSDFKKVNIETITEPTVWSLSIQNYLLRNKFSNTPRKGRMPGYIPLTLLLIPFSWLEKGKGPILRFWAKKT